MSERFVIADAYESPEVDLWGHIFVVRPFTKHVEESIGDLGEELAEKFADAKVGLDVVEACGRYFDVQLKRHPDETKQAKPSSLLRKHWELKDEKRALSAEQLARMFEFVYGGNADGLAPSNGDVPPT